MDTQSPPPSHLPGFNPSGLLEPEATSGLPARETPPEPPQVRSLRRRGGQPGNTNAFKHGLYARLFRSSELGRLEGVEQLSLQDEIDMFRLTIRRLVDRSSEIDSFEMELRYTIVLSHALSQLTRMVRTQALLPASDDVAAIISQAISETMEEMDIHL